MFYHNFPVDVKTLVYEEFHQKVNFQDVTSGYVPVIDWYIRPRTSTTTVRPNTRAYFSYVPLYYPTVINHDIFYQPFVANAAPLVVNDLYTERPGAAVFNADANGESQGIPNNSLLDPPPVQINPVDFISDPMVTVTTELEAVKDGFEVLVQTIFETH